jgi:NDP-sugar pyrophosphorylase family protein
MTRPRLRALVLAAGRGERLRPLTAAIPKPLLPVAGRPLAAWTLERLRDAGVEATAMNLHWLGGAIRERFGETYRGMPLRYSEESELLGTGGAIPPLRDFLADCDVALVVNGDSLCRWPIRELVAAHRRARPAATVLLHRGLDPRPFGGGAALEGDRVLAFRPGSLGWAAARRHAVFAGVQAISPELLARLPDGPSDLVEALYHPLLADGATIRAVETVRLWHDLGTPRRYLEGALDWALGGTRRGSRVVKGAEVAEGARLRRAVVERGATIEAGAALDASLVLPGAKVGAGARLTRVVVGPDAVVPPGGESRDRLYFVDASGATSSLPISA